MSGFVKADNVFVNQNAASRNDVLRFIMQTLFTMLS